MSWWTKTPVEGRVGANVFDVLVTGVHAAFAELALERGHALHQLDWEQGVMPAFFEEFEPLRSQLSLLASCYNWHGHAWISLYAWEEGVVKVTSFRSAPRGFEQPDGELDKEVTSFAFDVVTSDDEAMSTLMAMVCRHAAPAPPPVHEHPGHAYVLVSLPGRSPTLHPVGLSSKELVQDNYDGSALHAYERSVADMLSDSPRGRLTILEGPPGTGKTHMVRAFMGRCPQARFVFVQPHMLKDLADPGFVVSFIQELDGPGPIVIVLEDADACLAERKAENMGSISALLNLTDGVVGSLFDIRVLATTNTSKHEFDPALLRPGRLSAHIKLPKLVAAHAERVWQRLSGGRPFPETRMDTLADLYLGLADMTEAERAIAEAKEMRASV